MLRGINQQQIFEDSKDCDKFLQILKDCKAISGYKLFAYCLMGENVGTGQTVCTGCSDIIINYRNKNFAIVE